jgi:prepilin-type N-terminal cleavage/methylation domain-containing protein
MKLPIADCRLPIIPKGWLYCPFPIGNRQSAIGNVRSSFAEAFTLIEIMIVVAIIGLLAAMGAPALNKMLQKEGLRKALSDVEDVCFSAREQAIVFNKTTAVVFYLRERRFEVDGGGGGGFNAHSGKVTSATLPDGVDLLMLDIFRQEYVGSTQDTARIFFNSDGTCDEAVIVLFSKGQTEKITLEYATGMPVVSSVDR